MHNYAADLARAACTRPGWAAASLAAHRPFPWMEEVQHTGLVALVDFGPGHSQQLCHRGTGEHVVLAGGWALSFAGGLAMLTPDG